MSSSCPPKSAWCRCTGTKRFAALLALSTDAIIGGYRPAAKLGGKLAHQAVEARLPFEPNPWTVGQRQIAAANAGVVGKAAEIAEDAGIRFRPAEAEAGGDGERHLVAAVRKQRGARPTVALEHGNGA